VGSHIAVEGTRAGLESRGRITPYVISDGGPKAKPEAPTATSPRTRVRQEPSGELRQTSQVDQVLDDSFPASDPPSWTGTITRIAATSNVSERLVRQVRAEYLEMPGLCLTIQQAQRLWSLEPPVCAALLNSLTDSNFLRRNDRGLFMLSTPRG
jgi:hypothetical protein